MRLGEEGILPLNRGGGMVTPLAVGAGAVLLAPSAAGALLGGLLFGRAGALAGAVIAPLLFFGIPRGGASRR